MWSARSVSLGELRGNGHAGSLGQLQHLLRKLWIEKVFNSRSKISQTIEVLRLEMFDMAFVCYPLSDNGWGFVRCR